MQTLNLIAGDCDFESNGTLISGAVVAADKAIELADNVYTTALQQVFYSRMSRGLKRDGTQETVETP